LAETKKAYIRPSLTGKQRRQRPCCDVTRSCD